MRNLKVLLLSVGLVFSGTQCSVAHAELVKSFPVANSNITKSPKYVQLEFAEALTTLKNKNPNTITILGAKSLKIPTSKISVTKGIARVDIPGQLKAGNYTVQYRVVSADGHVLKSQFKFTLR
jgi:copper resistance protein C